MRRGWIGPITSVLVLTACGGGGATVNEGVGDAQAVVLAAADAALDVATMRASFEVEMRSEAFPDGAFTMTGTAAADVGPPYRMRMDMTVGALDRHLDTSMVLDETAVYTRMPDIPQGLPEDVEWIRYDLDEFAAETGTDFSSILQPGPQQDPTAVLQVLRGTSEEVTEIGEEEVRGVATTHYRATVSTEAALADAPEEARELLEAQQAKFPDTFPVDVWIDGDGLPRRFSFSQEFTVQGMTVEQSMTMELFDFGSDVDVSAPPAEVTIDSGELSTPPAGSSSAPTTGERSEEPLPDFEITDEGVYRLEPASPQASPAPSPAPSS